MLLLLSLIVTAQPADNTIDYHYYKTALVHKSKQQYKEAVIDFNIFLDDNPTHQNATYFRGYCRLYSNDFEGALEDFKTLMKMNPTSIDGSFGAAQTCYKSGQYKKAVDYYTKTLQLNKWHLPSYNDLGLAYCQLNKFGQAQQAFQQAIRIDSTFAMAYCNAGAARYFNQDQANPVRKDMQEAKDYFTQAIALDDELYMAYYNRAAVNYFMGEYSESLADINMAVLMDPRNAMNYFYSGVIYQKMGQPGRAMNEFKKAISLNPDLPFPYEVMADISKVAGDYELAETYYEQAANAAEAKGDSYKGLMAYRVAEMYAMNDKLPEMYAALNRAKALGVFDYRKVYTEFLASKSFKKHFKEDRLRKFTKSISRAKKTGDFLDPSMRWFRMQQGAMRYRG